MALWEGPGLRDHRDGDSDPVPRSLVHFMALTASSPDHCADGGSVTETLAHGGKVHVYEPASSQRGNTESQAMKSWPELVADQKRRI